MKPDGSKQLSVCSSQLDQDLWVKRLVGQLGRDNWTQQAHEGPTGQDNPHLEITPGATWNSPALGPGKPRSSSSELLRSPGEGRPLTTNSLRAAETSVIRVDRDPSQPLYVQYSLCMLPENSELLPQLCGLGLVAHRLCAVVSSLVSEDVCACVRAQSRPILCNFVDCSPPGSSLHGITHARIVKWVAIS